MDSVIALFRVDFTGRGELAEQQVNLEALVISLTLLSALVISLTSDVIYRGL